MTVAESVPTEFVKQTLKDGLETRNPYMVRLPFFRDKNEYVNENEVPVQQINKLMELNANKEYA